MARSADLSSFAATEVASHGFFIEIAVRLAAAQRLPGRITLRATPRHSAVTAQHGRAKTPHRVLCREKGSIHVRGPWPLGVLPRRAFGTDTRVCPPCRHGKEKQHAQPTTKEEKGRSAQHDGPTPPLRPPAPGFALTACRRMSSSRADGEAA